MLTQAQNKLAAFTGRVTFVQSDLATPEWNQPILGIFDLVVSSLVMHTVPGQVKEIYRQVFTLIKPEGCFIFADNLSPPGPTIENVYLKERLLAHQARIKTETGVVKSLKDIEAELTERRRSREKDYPDRVRNPLRGTLTLTNHLEWLKQAGFDEVDCLWKEMRHAVIGGFRH